MSTVAPEPWSAPERPDQPVGGGPTSGSPGEPADKWAAWSAPVALVAGLMGAFVGGLLVVVIAEIAGANATGDDTPPGVLLGATLVQDISLIAAAILFARLSGPVWAAQFGLRRSPFWLGVAGVFATYLSFVVFAAIWTAIVGAPDDEPLLDDLGVSESTLLLVLGMLTVCVGAPLVEEFFFRGFFYRALRNWAGIAGAAIITGVVFGLMHALSSPVENLVPLAVLGALFCLLYQYTGSLYPCIVLHAINNSVAFGVSEDWQVGEVLALIAGSVAICSLVSMLVSRTWRPRAQAA